MTAGTALPPRITAADAHADEPYGWVPLEWISRGRTRWERQELLPRRRILAQLAEQAGRDGRGAGRLDAANGHAQALRLKDHTDTGGWCERRIKMVSDLDGHWLLELQIARAMPHHTPIYN